MYYDRHQEITEAIIAGERALNSLREAKRSLGSAGTWGLFDLFGGKSFTGFVKHVKIGDAKSSLNRAKADLSLFSRELADVRDVQGLDIEIGSFLTFADFFFDGFLADVMVQSRIHKAQKDIDDAIRRVELLLKKLKEY